MAAALFRARAEKLGERDAWDVRSGGTWANESQPISAPAIAVMARRGIAIETHRAHQITRQDMEHADVVIVMTRNHRDALATEFAAHKRKIHLMSELDARDFDIADPYGGLEPEYEICAQELERLIERGYDRIKQWAQENLAEQPR